MAYPVARWTQSMGLIARDLTSMRSSVGPGVGVGRLAISKVEPLELRTAARCWGWDIVGYLYLVNEGAAIYRMRPVNLSQEVSRHYDRNGRSKSVQIAATSLQRMTTICSSPITMKEGFGTPD